MLIGRNSKKLKGYLKNQNRDRSTKPTPVLHKIPISGTEQKSQYRIEQQTLVNNKIPYKIMVSSPLRSPPFKFFKTYFIHNCI
jgi:hypothetical protein